MRKSLKLAALLAASALAVSMLAACGGGGNSSSDGETGGGGTSETGGDTEEQGSSGASGDATTITVWSNNRHDETYMTEMIDAFNSSHSDIQIDYVIMTDDWANSFQLAFQANTAPDIITIAASDGMTLQNYVDGGMFESLTPWIDADEEFQKVTEAKDHMYEGLNAIGDDIYWVPNGVRSGTRIEYNMSLVPDGIPSKLDDVIALAKKVTEEGGGSTYGVGFTSSGPFGRWLEGVGTMSGCLNSGYDYVNGTFDFSSWVPLLEKAAQFNADGSVLPGSFEQGVDASRAQFANGAFAIWGNASQEAGVFTDQFPPTGFEWGVAELPTLDGEVKGALACTPNFGFAMVTSAEDKDAAWEVIKYFSSEDFMKGYLEGGFTLPLSDYMTGVIDASKTGRLADFALKDYEDVFPTIPAVTIEGDDFYTTAMKVMQGHLTAQEACDDLTKRYNEALDRGLANGSCTRLVIKDYDPQHPSAGTPEYLTE